jgi:hypothetical protein
MSVTMAVCLVATGRETHYGHELDDSGPGGVNSAKPCAR